MEALHSRILCIKSRQLYGEGYTRHQLTDLWTPSAGSEFKVGLQWLQKLNYHFKRNIDWKQKYNIDSPYARAFKKVNKKLQNKHWELPSTIAWTVTCLWERTVPMLLVWEQGLPVPSFLHVPLLTARTEYIWHRVHLALSVRIPQIIQPLHLGPSTA